MKSIELDIQFSTGSVKWLDTIVDMKHISMYDHIKQDISDIGIQANCREAMFTWMQYQEDILFDELEGSFLDEFDDLEFDRGWSYRHRPRRKGEIPQQAGRDAHRVEHG